MVVSYGKIAFGVEGDNDQGGISFPVCLEIPLGLFCAEIRELQRRRRFIHLDGRLAYTESEINISRLVRIFRFVRPFKR